VSAVGRNETGTAMPGVDTHAPASKEDTPQGGFIRRHRRAVVAVLGAVVLVGFFYYMVPRFAGLGPTLRRLRAGDVWWLALGALLEATSIAGEVALFRGVFSRPANRVGSRISAEITLAGGVATKLVATAGAGGIALTVWALRGVGVPATEVATGMVCYEIITYAVYMGALAIGGLGLWFGVFAGRAPIWLTLVPALFGLTVIAIVVSMLFLDEPAERFLLRRAAASHGRLKPWWQRAAALPRSLQSGLKAALSMARRRDPSLIGAIVAWGFDIGALWASFHAFGHPPTPAVLVMGYYVGTLGNALPLPGGIGGVEGGMIGSFLAFGVNGSLAVLAVLGYRTISYWLPTVPGVIAYIRLRRRVKAAPAAAGRSTQAGIRDGNRSGARHV
jgi:putative heme transporter